MGLDRKAMEGGVVGRFRHTLQPACMAMVVENCIVQPQLSLAVASRDEGLQGRLSVFTITMMFGILGLKMPFTISSSSDAFLTIRGLLSASFAFS